MLNITCLSSDSATSSRLRSQKCFTRGRVMWSSANAYVFEDYDSVVTSIQNDEDGEPPQNDTLRPELSNVNPLIPAKIKSELGCVFFLGNLLDTQPTQPMG